MKARLSIVAGLIAGVAVAGLLLGGLVALRPGAPTLASPTPPLAIATPMPSAGTSVAPSVATSASPSASPSPSGSSAAGAFGVGQPTGVDVTP